MKPIDLVKRAIENSSLPGQLVYEPFGGSGTTMLAAHRTGRKCYTIEISPKYCDVILKRAEAEGIGPIELVNNGTTD
jgi:DNA modification methylase